MLKLMLPALLGVFERLFRRLDFRVGGIERPRVLLGALASEILALLRPVAARAALRQRHGDQLEPADQLRSTQGHIRIDDFAVGALILVYGIRGGKHRRQREGERDYAFDRGHEILEASDFSIGSPKTPGVFDHSQIAARAQNRGW